MRSEIDPEQVLLLGKLADAHLARLDGAGTLRRTAQAIAADAYQLGREEAERATAANGHRVSVIGIGEAARHLGRSKRHVRRLAASGSIPARKVGGTWLIEVTDAA